MNRKVVTLEPFTAADVARLAGWLTQPHVAPWYSNPESNVAWAKRPPREGDHVLIACDGMPVGYLRWQRVDRATLDAVGLEDVSTNVVDANILVGEVDAIAAGVGPAALELLVARLRSDASIPLIGLTTSAANTRAQRAFEKAGFRLARQYAPPGLGPCKLYIRRL